MRNKLPLLLFIIGSLFCATSSFADEHFFEIKAKKFSYDPHIIKVNKGDKVRIRLISEDVTHGIFVDGYGIETQAYPGQEGYIEFVANKTGRYSFRCSVTCGEFHPYMIGYLIVEPNTRFLIYVFLTVSIGLCILLFITLKKKTVPASNSIS